MYKRVTMFYPLFKKFQKLLHPSDFFAHLLTINLCIFFFFGGLLHKFLTERTFCQIILKRGPEEFTVIKIV